MKKRLMLPIVVHDYGLYFEWVLVAFLSEVFLVIFYLVFDEDKLEETLFGRIWWGFFDHGNRWEECFDIEATIQEVVI